MRAKWIFKNTPRQDKIEQICSILGFEKLESKILIQRGIDDLEKATLFFKPNISHIHNPFLMKNMQVAVERIASAIENGEKILIYGDYDVDGTSAVALMYLYLKKIYLQKNIDLNKYIEYYIPDRYTEGYGISIQGINFAKENHFSLIITLDCGIKSVKEVAYASSLGIDFIICDHHLPSDEIPNATAVLNPKQTDCPYPYKELSGCGVGFKLCQAINTIYKISDNFLYELTDLLAISIASDIVPVTGENRTLLKLGLKYLQKTKRLGFQLLIPPERLANFTTSNIVFEIAPKINAAGRITSGKIAVELMISDDEKQAHLIVEKILDQNNERKDKDIQITTEAKLQISDNQECLKSSIVVYSPNWSKGVIGIVASRLVESYYKPTLVFTDGNQGEMIASARSVSDFDIYQALEKCSDLLLKFGGHRAAAGLTLSKDNFQKFKTRFEKTVTESIKEYQKMPSLEIDTEIKPEELSLNFFSFYKMLAPFGPENMKPTLLLRNMETATIPQIMGKNREHIKFFININGINRECVGFGFGEFFEDFKSKKFDMVFSIEENHWKGQVSHFFNIKDIEFTHN